jgi:hypothetical protein
MARVVTTFRNGVRQRVANVVADADADPDDESGATPHTVAAIELWAQRWLNHVTVSGGIFNGGVSKHFLR